MPAFQFLNDSSRQMMVGQSWRVIQMSSDHCLIALSRARKTMQKLLQWSNFHYSQRHSFVHSKKNRKTGGLITASPIQERLQPQSLKTLFEVRKDSTITCGPTTIFVQKTSCTCTSMLSLNKMKAPSPSSEA